MELEIRRLCIRNPGFRSACEDYDVAAMALRHWQGAGDAFVARTTEYRQMLGNLEHEILRELDGHRSRVAQPED